MSPVAPAELLRRLVRIPSVNPPGGERAAVEYLAGVLRDHDVEPMLIARDPERPNLVARVAGRGEAPPLLLYGHADVVPVAGQAWTADPFGAEDRDGFTWGRGTLDMKGGLAMMVAAFLRCAAEPPPGDVLLCVVSDEEAGGVYGARHLVETRPELFAGVRHAAGEFGGFTLHVAGRRLYPVMVAEKQACRVTARFHGPGGHGSLPARGGAMAALGRALGRLDRSRLPVHVTPPVRAMLEAVAAALPGPRAAAVRALLAPPLTDAVLGRLGAEGRAFDALLHNTVNATMVAGGTKVNVVPSLVELQLDGRILPGLGPGDLAGELRRLLGEGFEIGIDHFDPGPPSVDMSAFDVFASVLSEADPGGRPVPFVLPAVTDARFFARLGIQTYGFTPMRLPPGFDFQATIHAADERIPAGEVEWGADRVEEAVRRYR